MIIGMFRKTKKQNKTKKQKTAKVMYSQSPLPRTSACRPCCLCVPRWGTCPGTRRPCGDESCRCAAGAPPACPCRLLPVWGGVPGGGGRPGRPAKLHASWVFPSNTGPPPAHHALPWPPPSPPSRASEAERAAAIRHLRREQTCSVVNDVIALLCWIDENEMWLWWIGEWGFVIIL